MEPFLAVSTLIRLISNSILAGLGHVTLLKQKL